MERRKLLLHAILRSILVLVLLDLAGFLLSSLG